ncbi:hypothetical protein CSPHI_00495 [Corynebacterium sphenisci DSM 44792]|uniref:tRNA adenosine deaminase n=1 Tax=Corynebacterium sphenisci DSM 44792 TaxID=1437874 RepID=A0A1L7CVJ1_9CORY|nr:tRNA adenosine deaminase-associated protein [Corynebacterium sphenisci]APT89821.1 hypothetical protein CSPHI_00495 [Corynebacterium sphenisci DSM 44792]
MSTTDREYAGADEDRSYAVAVTLAEEGWSVTELDDAALDSLAGAVSRLRRLRAERACFALLNIDDDYFIILRPVPGAVHALLSDATAAVTDDIAAEVLDELDEEVPDLDEDEAAAADPWPEGDLGLLADVGLPEDVLAVICEDANLWASEQLHAVAQVLGFDDELAEVTGYGVDDD